MLVENPILRGFNPDPCLCSARGKFYLATSTFQWVPGVSLYESDDLATWRHLGGALQGLDLRGIPDSGGVWAPDLTYDSESGLFWLVYTIAKQIDGIFKDVENYATCASDIEGPWSEPVFVNASGFDPGMFHEDGRHYVINPQWDPRPLDGHHRFNGLLMQEFSLERGLIGEPRKVLGNEDAVNWLREGPHIMKHDSWYYILCAEGGTGRRHRIRAARSRELWGPYEVCPEPLVCSWLSKSRLRKAGHGNLAQASDGTWYACHLASRYLPPRDGESQTFDEHESGISPLGRETAIERVAWKDGWPRLAGGGVEPRVQVDIAGAAQPQSDPRPGEAGYRYETSFPEVESLWKEGWLAPRRVDFSRMRSTSKGILLSGGDSPSSLFDRVSLSRRVTSFSYHAECSLSFSPTRYNQFAGLICEYDSRAFCCLAVGWDEEACSRALLVLAHLDGGFEMPLGAECPHIPDDVEAITLSVDVDTYDLRFSYAFDGGETKPVLLSGGEPLVLDASAMSDERVSGWAYTGSMVGITCVDMADKTATAAFSHFAYEDVRSGEALRSGEGM